MDNWQQMFTGVHAIARSCATFEAGLAATVAFARADASQYNAEFWSRVERHDWRPSQAKIVRWAQQGLLRLRPSHPPLRWKQLGASPKYLERLSKGARWDFLILDLGDCPEIFRLYGFANRSAFAPNKFKSLIASRTIVSFDDFEEAFDNTWPTVPPDLYNCKWRELADRNVHGLKDDILTWNVSRSTNFNGDDGYLLWLAFGSLALIEPLRDPDFCAHILRGRRKLHLLSGYEEIFFHLATISPRGLHFVP